MNISQFVKICKLNQPNLKKYVFKKLHKTHDDVTWQDGFIYARGTFPVLLVAHLDTVHKHNVKNVLYKDGKIESPQGIGGDDRCGVYMILEIAKKYNCSVLFCEDEEIGGVGATKFTKSECFLDVDANYIIELDRRGSTDAVFYSCDNPDFTKFICKDYFKESHGTFSDISIIAPDLGISAVNLSSGYYNAHTEFEYVVEKDVDRIIEEVYNVLDRTDDTIFEYIEKKYTYSNWYSERYLNEYGYQEEDEYEAYEIEFTNGCGETDYTYIWATSEEDAIFKFLVENQYIPYASIVSITNLGDMGIGGWR